LEAMLQEDRMRPLLIHAVEGADQATRQLRDQIRSRFA